MRDPNQKTRYNDAEMALLKSMFEHREEALYLIKRVLLQDKLEQIDKDNLREMINDQSWALIKKVLMPDLDPSAPLGQSASLMMYVGTDVKGLSPDGAWPFIKAKSLELEYLAQQLEVLKNPDLKPEILLSDFTQIDGPKTNRESIYINVLVWNWLVGWVESCVTAMKTLALQTKETTEERDIRIAKDSSK